MHRHGSKDQFLKPRPSQARWNHHTHEEQCSRPQMSEWRFVVVIGLLIVLQGCVLEGGLLGWQLSSGRGSPSIGAETFWEMQIVGHYSPFCIAMHFGLKHVGRSTVPSHHFRKRDGGSSMSSSRCADMCLPREPHSLFPARALFIFLSSLKGIMTRSTSWAVEHATKGNSAFESDCCPPLLSTQTTLYSSKCRARESQHGLVHAFNL